MLSENIRAIRKSKGLSQEELAVKLNVVRQTISKWEHGLSVPDSDLLIAIADALDTSVSTLLGESVVETQPEDVKVICEKLELINLQLAQRKEQRRKIFHWLFLSLFLFLILAAFILFVFHSSYLGWNYHDPETAVMGTVLHASEWLLIRLLPILLLMAGTGIFLTRRKDH